MTDTGSDKNRECIGQGIANIVAGLFGGMAGCAMIGQSVINVKSGGRGRLSTFVAGAFLLFLLLVLGDDLVGQIPMPALVAVMIMVSIGTFSWASLGDLRTHPRRSSIVMLATVLIVVGTHDLALGVVVGVLLSGVFFAGKVAQIFRVSSSSRRDGETRDYRVEGQVFFASADSFVEAFDFGEPVEAVRIDVTRAHIWDLTGVGALDKVGAEVPPRGRGGRGHRPERGQRHHHGQAGGPRSAGRHGEGLGPLMGEVPGGYGASRSSAPGLKRLASMVRTWVHRRRTFPMADDAPADLFLPTRRRRGSSTTASACSSTGASMRWRRGTSG